jgi:uncharacterized repeat protein (TIGR01451 family)
MLKEKYGLFTLFLFLMITSTVLTNYAFALPNPADDLRIIIVDIDANEGNGGIFALEADSSISSPQISEIKVDNEFVSFPIDVAVDNNGDLIVIQNGDSVVRISNPLEQNPTLTPLASGPPFGFLTGVAVEQNNDIIVVDADGALFRISGTTVTPITPQDENPLLVSPFDVAIDTDGTIIVLDDYDPFDPSDLQLAQGPIVSIDPDTGNQSILNSDIFSNAASIEINSNGEILVTDADDGIVYRVERIGDIRTQLLDGGFGNLYGIAIDEVGVGNVIDDVWLSDSAAENDDGDILGYDSNFSSAKSFSSDLFQTPTRLDVLNSAPSTVSTFTINKTGQQSVNYIPGGTFNYTIIANNTGPDPTNIITIVDTLPSGLRQVASETRINGQLITIPNDTLPKNLCSEVAGIVTCSGFGLIDVNNQIEIKLNVTFAQPLSGSIRNTATVTSQSGSAQSIVDTNVSNNSGDLRITQFSSNKASLKQGESITFTIKALNKQGQAQATNVRLDMTLNGLSLISVTNSGSGTLSCATLPCNVGTLTNTQEATVTVVASVISGNTPTISNSASVTSDLTDITPSDNQGGPIITTVKRPPIVIPIPPKTGNELSLITFNVNATDINIPIQALSFGLSGAPPSSSISPAGAFTWTPSEIQGPGVFNFNVTVANNDFIVSTPVIITVNEVNQKPILDPIPPKNTNELSALTFNTTAFDPDIPPNSLTFSLSGTIPSGASISPAGAFTWTPSEIQGPGVFNFNVTVTDNGIPPLSDTRRVNITVNEVNLPPVITQISNQTMSQGQTLTIPITAFDPDIPPNALALTGISPSFSTLIDNNNGTGSITFLPSSADVGFHTVTITVTDNGLPPLSNSTSFQLTVLANSPPVAVNDSYDVNANDALTIPPPGVLGNDSDPDFDTLTVSLQTNTVSGNVVLNPNGGFTFTASQIVFGTDSFTYVANDGTIDSNVATVTLTQKFCGKTIDQFDEIIIGTPGNDKLKGTHGDDLIIGLGGDDKINGLKGDDCLIGGDGDDKINGNQGNDTLIGGNGDDKLNGNHGDDTIQGGSGKDKIHGNHGNDIITGDDGDDKIHGGNGNDNISGGNGNDNISGGQGDDIITGDDGDDKIHGGNGNDNISGGQGNDTIHGQQGHDNILGDSGNDKIHGGQGNDFIDGGIGTDRCNGDKGNNTIINCEVEDKKMKDEVEEEEEPEEDEESEDDDDESEDKKSKDKKDKKSKDD